MNIRRKITTAALTGVLLVGGASAAFADDAAVGHGVNIGGDVIIGGDVTVYRQLPPWWPGHPGEPGPGWPGHPGGRPDRPERPDFDKCETTDQGTLVCRKGCFAQNKRGKWIPVDCPCTERNKRGKLVEVDCPVDDAKDCPKHGDKCTKGGRKKVTTAPVHRGRQHPVTGTAAALYAVGGGLLAATGGTLLVSKKRRNNA